MKKKSFRTRIVLLANFILDKIVARMRWLFLPFKLITVFLGWLYRLTWFLSNEFTKTQLGQCGRGVRIHGRFHVTGAKNIHLGSNIHINENAFFRGEGGLFIGDNTHISRNLIIYTVNHQYQGTRLPYDEQKVLKPVHVGANVWIGMNVLIVPGVSIGDGAIIGMGTIVSQDVPALAIIGSAAQRILKTRDEAHYNHLIASKSYGGMGGYEWE